MKPILEKELQIPYTRTNKPLKRSKKYNAQLMNN